MLLAHVFNGLQFSCYPSVVCEVNLFSTIADGAFWCSAYLNEIIPRRNILEEAAGYLHILLLAKKQTRT